MSTQHIAEGQSLSPDALVELFTLDTSMLTNIYGVAGTGSVYNWTAGSLNGASVSFGGVVYAPMPIETAGFEWNGQGKLPRPTLKVANISGLATGLVIEYGDMLGARVTRLRTFAKFLDGKPTADSSAHYEPDEFRVDRKSVQNKHYVEWELAADFDQQNIRLPKRQVLRDACSETYRVFAAGFFHPGTCPYAGGAMFDISNNAVFTQKEDVCNHRLTGCQARYPGKNNPIPFAGWPGVAQTAI